jgi:hypothetical protein
MAYRIHISLALIFLLNCTVFGQVQKTFFPSGLLIRDLEFTKKSLDGLHPGLNRFGQKATFDEAYQVALAALRSKDSLTTEEFFRIVNPFVAQARCGHIKFMPWSKDFPFFYHVENVFPGIVRFEQSGRLLIIKSGTKELPGNYIIEINGKPIDQIIAELKSQMMVDGFSQTAASAQIEQYFSAWYADFIQERDDFEVVISDETGQSKKLDLKGISSKEWISLNEGTDFLKTKNDLQFLTDSVAYLRLPVFYGQHGDKQFLSYLDSAFAEIQKKNAKELIIDLRDNEGGNDRLGEELFAHIARRPFPYYDRIEVKVKSKKQVPNYRNAYFPKFIGLAHFFIRRDDQGRLLFKKHKNLGLQKARKNAFQGKVWFVMNGRSYSVTSEFLAVAKSENRGTFVGVESGGTYQGNNSGTFVIFKLPVTKLDLGIPVAGYYNAVKPESELGRGILPNFSVLPDRKDLLENRDPVVPFILDKIKNK